jgi:hypothetical protein
MRFDVVSVRAASRCSRVLNLEHQLTKMGRYKVRLQVPRFQNPLSTQVNILGRPVDVFLNRDDAHQRGNLKAAPVHRELGPFFGPAEPCRQARAPPTMAAQAVEA